MELSELIQSGMTNEATFLVEEEHLARQVGSGSLRVLATPWMITFMERVSHRLLTCCLPEGQSSVGAWLEVRHLAPTPLGGIVRVRSEVISVDGIKVFFKVEAWDEVEQVGVAQHERVVIDTGRFFKRIEKKRQQLGLSAGE